MSPVTSRAILASNGAYPRNGDAPEEQALRKTTEAFHRGERTIADLIDAENAVTRFLIHEQLRAGVEMLTDGCARWRDPISHIAAKFDGIMLGEKRPLPGTQIHYRVPRLLGKLSWKNAPGRTLADEYRFARNGLGQLPTSPECAGRLCLKPVLVGPYTLARYSESERPEFASIEARAEAFAEMLALEIAALAAAGASLIQIDEPAILAHPEDWEILRSAFTHITTVRDGAARGSRRVQLALHVYGGPQAPLLTKLLKLPADVIGLDFASDTRLASAWPEGDARGLAAGIVSGREATLESESTVRQTLNAILAKASPVAFGPASGMEGLTREVASAKFRVLQAALRG